MKRANIREVARLANVSRQTVSRVLNEVPGVTPQTLEKVRKAIDELDYIPTKTAKSLVSQKTNTIGLVLADITNPFFPGFARGVFDQANHCEYNVLLCNTDDRVELEMKAITDLAQQPVDGIIIFSNRSDKAFLTKLAKPFMPFVLINRPAEFLYSASVQSGNLKGGALAANHLIERGCKEIGFIGRSDPTKPLSKVRRFKGFRNALSAHNLSVEDSHTELAVPNDEGGYDAAVRLLRRQPSIDGLFCYSDYMALGVLRACKEMRIRVPNDLKVVGYDGIKVGDLTEPRLTTVNLDEYVLGVNSFKQLHKLMSNPQGKYRPIWVQPELLIKDST